MGIERSQTMIRAAYFFAKYGDVSAGGQTKPPIEIGVSSWTDAYRRLFPQLGDGRTFETFRGSINQDRKHYIDCFAGRKTDSEDRCAILGDFVHRSRAEQWAQICNQMN